MTDKKDHVSEESDTERDQYTVQHDWQSSEELAVTVTCAVAAVKGVCVSNVGPLSESVNPDALNEIFDPLMAGGPSNRKGYLEFVVDGCKVTADSDGQIVIHPPDS